jgi:hypothetical protein
MEHSSPVTHEPHLFLRPRGRLGRHFSFISRELNTFLDFTGALSSRRPRGIYFFLKKNPVGLVPVVVRGLSNSAWKWGVMTMDDGRFPVMMTMLDEIPLDQIGSRCLLYPRHQQQQTDARTATPASLLGFPQRPVQPP